MTVEEGQDDVQRVPKWISPLDAFASALDDIEGAQAIDFCENSCEAWQNILTSDPPPKTSPAMVIALDSLNALLTTMTAVTMDWADTPDVRDRFTRESAQQRAKDTLYAILRDCKRWLSEGLPSDAVVQQRISAVIEEVKQAMELIEKRNAEFDEQDAESGRRPVRGDPGLPRPKHGCGHHFHEGVFVHGGREPALWRCVRPDSADVGQGVVAAHLR